MVIRNEVTLRVTRDLQAIERRPKQAARSFAKGNLPQASVARELRVSRMSVSRWRRQLKKSGKEALRAEPRAGRKPLLNPRQRIAGVRYHPGHVWKILGARNWTLQKPERQAKERNSDLVDYWKTVRWPELKKTLLASAPGSSSKTKPDSPSNPRSAGRGRREGKHRS